MSGKFGFSWSWKRAIGLSAEKAKISREIGVPLTRSGRDRKLGAWLLGDSKHHAHEHEGERTHPVHHTHRGHKQHIGWGLILLLLGLFIYNVIAGPPAPGERVERTAARTPATFR